MKNCTNCEWANWQRTDSGRLHPSGSGQCRFPYAAKPLPQAFYWLGSNSPSGGYINRRKELNDDCVYFAREVQP